VAAVGGLPAAPSAGSPLNDAPETPFQNSLRIAKAAGSAASSWHEAAAQVVSLIENYDREMTAISNRTGDEAAELVRIQALKAPAQTQVTNAEALRDAVGVQVKTLATRCNAWTVWANQRQRNTGTTAQQDGTKRLQTVNGFVKSLDLETGSAPQARKDLIRVAPSLEKIGYTGPPTETVTVGGTDVVIDMTHITDRHVRGTYMFQGESSPTVAEHDIGILTAGKVVGLSGSDKSTGEVTLAEQGGRNKANSFFPTSVDAAKAKDLAAQAMLAVNTMKNPKPLVEHLKTLIVPAPPGPPPLRPPWEKVWVQEAVTVSLPPDLSVTIGIALTSDPAVSPPPAHAKARMFYPNNGDKLSTPDVLVLSRALGM